MKSSTVRVVQQHLCQCMEYRIRYVCDGSHALHLIQRIIKAFVLLYKVIPPCPNINTRVEQSDYNVGN